MRVSEKLNKAADLIEERGWSRDEGERRTSFCVSNAIAYVGAAYDPAHAALISYLGVDGLSAVFAWNDAPERTEAEVIEALRAAAVIEAAREDATVPAHA